MTKHTGTEYVQNSGECPYCGSYNIDGGINNSFEGDTMISGGCKCNTCGATWAESYTLDGWIEEVEDGPDVYHQDTRPQEIEQERDKFRDLLKTIAEIRLDGEEDPETGTVEMDIDSAFALLSDVVTKARAELGIEED